MSKCSPDAADDDAADDDARAMTIPRCFLRKTAELKMPAYISEQQYHQSSTGQISDLFFLSFETNL